MGTPPPRQPCISLSCKTRPSDFEREARNLSLMENFQPFNTGPIFTHTAQAQHGTLTGSAQKPILRVCEPQGLGPFLLRITESQHRTHRQTMAVAGGGGGGWELKTWASPSCLCCASLPCLSTYFSSPIPVCVSSVSLLVPLCMCLSPCLCDYVSAHLSTCLSLLLFLCLYISLHLLPMS